MINQPAQEDTEERRRYFRIDDEITLFYSRIPVGEIPGPKELGDRLPDSYALVGALEALTEESRVVLRKLERDLPEVSDYLKVLDQKIDLLAQTLLINQTDVHQQPTRNVNLSASGVAFESDTALEPGDYIELKMILPPSFLAMLTYGKVIYCDPVPSDGGSPRCRVGVDFLNLLDRDREALIRHVVRTQMRQIRDLKESP